MDLSFAVTNAHQHFVGLTDINVSRLIIILLVRIRVALRVLHACCRFEISFCLVKIVEKIKQLRVLLKVFGSLFCCCLVLLKELIDAQQIIYQILNIFVFWSIGSSNNASTLLDLSMLNSFLLPLFLRVLLYLELSLLLSSFQLFLVWASVLTQSRSHSNSCRTSMRDIVLRSHANFLLLLGFWWQGCVVCEFDTTLVIDIQSCSIDERSVAS